VKSQREIANRNDKRISKGKEVNSNSGIIWLIPCFTYLISIRKAHKVLIDHKMHDKNLKGRALCCYFEDAVVQVT
jgi:hypothetical protein